MPDPSNTTQQVQAVTATITSLFQEAEHWHEADLAGETSHAAAQAHQDEINAQIAELHQQLQQQATGKSAPDTSSTSSALPFGLTSGEAVALAALAGFVLWQMSQRSSAPARRRRRTA